MSKKSSKASTSLKHSGHSETSKSSFAGHDSKPPVHPPPVVASSSNKFSDLLFEPSSAFFQEEDSGASKDTPSGVSDGSKLVKILEATRMPNETTMSPQSTTRRDNELSLNAPSFTPLSRMQSSSPPTPPPQAPAEPPMTLWIYLDPNGDQQGPFTSAQMMAWVDAGYFPKNLPVFWYKTGDVVPQKPVFHPLDLCYPPGTTPFVTPPILPNPRLSSPPKPHPVAAENARGWLWSAEEDAKLGSTRSQQSLSLSDIIKAEEARKKGGKGKK